MDEAAQQGTLPTGAEAGNDCAAAEDCEVRLRDLLHRRAAVTSDATAKGTGREGECPGEHSRERCGLLGAAAENGVGKCSTFASSIRQGSQNH